MNPSTIRRSLRGLARKLDETVEEEAAALEHLSAAVVAQVVLDRLRDPVERVGVFRTP